MGFGEGEFGSEPFGGSTEVPFDLRFGDFTLDGCSELQGDARWRINEHRFPRRPGTIAPRVPARDANRIPLRGEIWKDSEAQIIQYFELLGKKLDGGRDRLFIRDNNRFLNAVAEFFNWRFVATRRPDVTAAYDLGFYCDDPFFYASAVSAQTETVGAANTATFSVTNNGGARTSPAFQVKRTSSANDQADITITHTTTGLFLKWEGTLPDGNIVTFDTANRRVTALGANGLNNFTGSIMLELEPGLNNFQYDGPGNVGIVIAWHERWGLA